MELLQFTAVVTHDFFKIKKIGNNLCIVQNLGRKINGGVDLDLGGFDFNLKKVDLRIKM